MAVTTRLAYVLTVLEDGQLQVRRDIVYEDDGVEVFRKHHRQVLAPGQDVSGFPSKVQSIAAVVWTPQVIADYQAKLNETTGVLSGSSGPSSAV